MRALKTTPIASVLYALVVLTIVLLAYASWSQGSLQWLYRFRFPYHDYASVTSVLDANPSPTLFDLYNMINSNEHRIVIPYYFYLADRKYFGSSSEFLYWSIYAFNVLTAAVLIAPLLMDRDKVGTKYVVLAAAAIVYWFFAAFNWENLTFQIQVCETASVALLVLAMASATMVSGRAEPPENQRRDWLWSALTGLLCLGASYSFGMGLVAWPIIGAHALITRWRAAPAVIFAVAAIITLGSYAYWYLFLADFHAHVFHTSPGSALHHPQRFALFVMNVLGWPPSQLFTGVWPPNSTLLHLASLALTLVAGGLAVVLVARAYLQRTVAEGRQRRAVQAVAMAVVSGVAIAVLTGLSRSGAMNGWGRSSYAVAASLFWCGLLVLAVLTQDKRAKGAIVVFAVLTTIMAYAPARAYELDITERDQLLYRGGVLASYGEGGGPGYPTLNGEGVATTGMWRAPRVGAPSFAERQPFGWLGQNLETLHFPAARGACRGRLEAEQRRANPRVRTVQGWALTSSGRSRWILLADPTGKVVGVGKPGLPSDDLVIPAARLLTNPWDDQRHARFDVLALTEPSTALSLWVIDSRGGACRVPTPPVG